MTQILIFEIRADL